MVPAETEEEDLAVSEDQILYSPDRGRRRGIRIEEIAADQNSAGMEFPRLPAQPAKCIHELRASVRGGTRIEPAAQVRVQMQVAAVDDLHIRSP